MYGNMSVLIYNMYETMLFYCADMASYPMLSNAIEAKHRAAQCWAIGETPHPLHTRTSRYNWKIHPAWVDR